MKVAHGCAAQRCHRLFPFRHTINYLYVLEREVKESTDLKRPITVYGADCHFIPVLGLVIIFKFFIDFQEQHQP